MSADLHLHTYHSDGTWSPAELIETARKLKLSHIAITDHDTVAAIAEAKEHAGDDITLIPGIEINGVDKTPAGEQFDVHVLGYFIDPESPELKAVMSRQQAAREQLVDDVVAKLATCGLKISRDDIVSAAGRGSIGRPHICKAIVAAGGARDIEEAFQKYMSRKSEYYVPRRSVAPQEAVQAIRAAGGIASVAHPGKDQRMPEAILKLKEFGLQAVEAYHRSHSLELVKHYLKFARQNQLLVTGGSDCHGRQHGYPPSIGSVRVPLQVVQDLQLQLADSQVSVLQ